MRIAAQLFAEQGVRAPVREIAERAGIQSGSLYHHFISKDAMVEELLATFWADSIAGYERAIAEGNGPEQRVRGMLVAVLRAAVDRAPEFLILHNDWHYLTQFPQFSFLDESAARTEDLWVSVLKDGIQTGVFRSTMDPQLAYRTIMGAAVWVVRWFKPNGPLTVEDIAAGQAEMWFCGIRS